MSSKSRKTRAKKKAPREPLDGKRDPTSQLYRAVLRYVKSKGGNILVIGGVEIQEWSAGDAIRGKFTLGIKCLGKRPSGTSSESQS
jgi:hypothetical protein